MVVQRSKVATYMHPTMPANAFEASKRGDEDCPLQMDVDVHARHLRSQVYESTAIIAGTTGRFAYSRPFMMLDKAPAEGFGWNLDDGLIFDYISGLDQRLSMAIVSPDLRLCDFEGCLHVLLLLGEEGQRLSMTIVPSFAPINTRPNDPLSSAGEETFFSIMEAISRVEVPIYSPSGLPSLCGLHTRPSVTLHRGPCCPDLAHDLASPLTTRGRDVPLHIPSTVAPLFANHNLSTNFGFIYNLNFDFEDIGQPIGQFKAHDFISTWETRGRGVPLGQLSTVIPLFVNHDLSAIFNSNGNFNFDINLVYQPGYRFVNNGSTSALSTRGGWLLFTILPSVSLCLSNTIGQRDYDFIFNLNSLQQLLPLRCETC